MASVYPGGLDNFATNKANGTATPTDHPNHHNDLADAINKIEAAIGIQPARLTPSLLQADPFLYWATDLGSTTFVNITGTQTVTADNGLLGVMFQDQAANDINCRLIAHTFAVGDSFVVPVRLFTAVLEDFTMAFLIFADGATSAANAVALNFYLTSGVTQGVFEVREGTLTAMTTADWSQNFTLLSGQADWVYLRLTYQAANTFRLQFSWDGINWTSFNQADATFTLAPTHVGVGWSSWGGATDNVRSATFGPVYKVA